MVQGYTIYVNHTWFVQIAHYPLFSCVGNSEFAAYECRHRSLTTWVVAIPMLTELVTSGMLIWLRPEAIPVWGAWAGFALVAVLWASTAWLQVPCHGALSRGYDAAVHRRLVATNWLRTAGWTIRSVLLLWFAWTALGQSERSHDNPEEGNVAGLKIGDRAPDFSATTSDGNPVRLADFLGKRALVLFFYPKDGTPVCTKEACAFRDSYDKFVQAGADVIGVSSDDEASHQSFAREHKLSFPLISDTTGALRKTFAVPKTLGLFPGRVTYVIDKEGVIRQIFSAQFASDEHVRQALSAVESSAAGNGQ